MSKTISQIIKETALSLNGIKEIKSLGNNQAFSDQYFQDQLSDVGWQKGWAYCSLTGKLIWMKSYVDAGYSTIAARIAELFSPSAVTTYRNFYDSEFQVTMYPEVGSLIVWQRYNSGDVTWQGHLGVVVEVFDQFHVMSLEGNTKRRVGSAENRIKKTVIREGEGIYLMERHSLNMIMKNGLNLMGFIHPKIIETL